MPVLSVFEFSVTVLSSLELSALILDDDESGSALVSSILEEMLVDVELSCGNCSLGVPLEFPLHPDNNITAATAAASVFFFINDAPFVFALHCKKRLFFIL